MKKHESKRDAIREANTVSRAANAEIRKLKAQLKAGTVSREERDRRLRQHLAAIGAAVEKLRP